MPSITSYEQAAAFIAGGRNKVSRKALNNTYVEILHDTAIGVKLHATHVVTYYANGVIKLDTGGWLTVTTKSRINEFTPNEIRVTSKRTKAGSRWVVSTFATGTTWSSPGEPAEFVYEDGMFLSHDGNRWTSSNAPSPAKVAKADAANAKMNAKIKTYVDLYTDEKIAELVEHAAEHGMAGDCWFCVMRTKEGVPLGDAQGDTNHLLSHLEDGYTMASLMLNALQSQGNSREDAMRWVQVSYLNYRTREAIGFYLRNALYTGGVATKNGRRPVALAVTYSHAGGF